MARPYCARCKTQVILDSDGVSCPNCKAVLVQAVPVPTASPPSGVARKTGAGKAAPDPAPVKRPHTKKTTAAAKKK